MWETLSCFNSSSVTVRMIFLSCWFLEPSSVTNLLMAYLPPEHAEEGKDLQVMYMNEVYPVTVARVGSTPLFDPENTRMKG